MNRESCLSGSRRGRDELLEEDPELLVTANVADFKLFKGLRVLNWLAA